MIVDRSKVTDDSSPHHLCGAQILSRVGPRNIYRVLLVEGSWSVSPHVSTPVLTMETSVLRGDNSADSL